MLLIVFGNFFGRNHLGPRVKMLFFSKDLNLLLPGSLNHSKTILNNAHSVRISETLQWFKSVLRSVERLTYFWFALDLKDVVF